MDPGYQLLRMILNKTGSVQPVLEAD
jgi:hypothetical protein